MKGLVVTGLVTVLILVGGVFLLSKGNNSVQKPVTVDQSILVKDRNHQTNKGAPVTIVEFGDYRCPACKQAFPAIKQVVQDYGTKINFVFKNYAFLPDSGTNTQPNASTLAANAAECAFDQNKFWEMHDWLYTNQPIESDISLYTVDKLTAAASSLGMDKTVFKTCLAEKKYTDNIQKDFADGQLAGVTGTPSFYVNGQLFPGVPSYADFKSLLDQLLSQK